MAISREKKKKILDQLKEKITKQKIIIFVDFTGVKSKDLFALRGKISEVGGEMKVAKKTLINLALKEMNLNLVDVKKLIGEVAVIFGIKDEISSAKIVSEFSKENKNLKILGGILERKFIEPEKIEEIASLPSREQLLARLVGELSAPISNFVCLLKSIPQSLLFVLYQIQTKVQK